MAVTRSAGSDQDTEAAGSEPAVESAAADEDFAVEDFAVAPLADEDLPADQSRHASPLQSDLAAEEDAGAAMTAEAAAYTVDTLPVATSVVRLEPGLYAVEILTDDAMFETGASPASQVWLALVPSVSGALPDMLSAEGSGDQWLNGADKIVAIRAPHGGSVVTATMFGTPEQLPVPPQLIVHALESGLPSIEPRPVLPPPELARSPVSQPAMPRPIVAPAARSEREIPIEVSVHIERLGDRTFGSAAWAGRPGEQKRVEGFSIRPLQELQPSEVEYKALHPGGIETPWTPGPQYCGTRGQSLPITGLAVRIAPHVQDQFSVVYQAAFFRSGISEPRGNGAPCLPRLAGDALEGINIRITQRRFV